MKTKSIDLKLTNQLTVSGFFVEPTDLQIAPDDLRVASVVSFRFAVSEDVRPYQLFVERDLRNDYYEDNDVKAGYDHWVRYAIEGAIPCKMCCNKATARAIANINPMELITIYGQLGNPLVLCEEGGIEPYESEETLLPTTIFVKKIEIPRTKKIFEGYPL